MELNGHRFAGELVLIDARPFEEFAGVEPGMGVTRPGHIPTAQQVCWTENLTGDTQPIFRSAEELRRLYATVGLENRGVPIVYCRTGMQASLTYFVLRYLGYEPALYDGSFIEWSANSEAPVEQFGEDITGEVITSAQ